MIIIPFHLLRLNFLPKNEKHSFFNEMLSIFSEIKKVKWYNSKIIYFSHFHSSFYELPNTLEKIHHFIYNKKKNVYAIPFF